MVEITIILRKGRPDQEIQHICSGGYVSASHLMFQCITNGWDWEVDLRTATKEERKEYLMADMRGKVFTALKKGRPVTFSGVEYNSPEKDRESILRICEEIERAFSRSGLFVTIATNDATHLAIEGGVSDNLQ